MKSIRGCFSLVLLLSTVLVVGLTVGAGCASLKDAVSTAAPLVDPLLRAIGFCKDHKSDVQQAVALVEKGDRLGAALQVALLVEELRGAGVEIPSYVDSDLVRTMAAVEGLQRGLRALSCRDPETGKPVEGCAPK